MSRDGFLTPHVLTCLAIAAFVPKFIYWVALAAQQVYKVLRSRRFAKRKSRPIN